MSEQGKKITELSSLVQLSATDLFVAVRLGETSAIPDITKNVPYSSIVHYDTSGTALISDTYQNAITELYYIDAAATSAMNDHINTLSGGVVDQVLTKMSDNDFDYEWVYPVDAGEGLYVFSSATDASDPGEGYWKTDNSDTSQATKLYISSKNTVKEDLSVLIRTVKYGSKFLLQSQNDNTSFYVIDILDTGVIDNGTWFEVPIDVKFAGTQISHNQNCNYYTGYAGDLNLEQVLFRGGDGGIHSLRANGIESTNVGQAITIPDGSWISNKTNNGTRTFTITNDATSAFPNNGSSLKFDGSTAYLKGYGENGSYISLSQDDVEINNKSFSSGEDYSAIMLRNDGARMFFWDQSRSLAAGVYAKDTDIELFGYNGTFTINDTKMVSTMRVEGLDPVDDQDFTTKKFVDDHEGYVTTGGTTNQVLTKLSNTDYDYDWVTSVYGQLVTITENNNTGYGLRDIGRGYKADIGSSAIDFSFAESSGGYGPNAIGSFAIGLNNSTSGVYSFVGGVDNKTDSDAGFIVGSSNEAYGGPQQSIFGSSNKGYEQCVAIFGQDNIVSAADAFAEGRNNLIGNGSFAAHAEGADNKIWNGCHRSHVEGQDNNVRNHTCHAEGQSNTVDGPYGHVEGNHTYAGGSGTNHAEGQNTSAFGFAAHAEGGYTTAKEDYAHSEGSYTNANGQASHAEGGYTTTVGIFSHAEGLWTLATGEESHAEGQFTSATGNYTHSEGFYTMANGDGAHAEGYHAIIEGGAPAGHVEGYYTYVNMNSGPGTHAEGFYASATSVAAHAEGRDTLAAAPYSHAEGYGSTLDGGAEGGHVEGYYTYANMNMGQGSHAEGFRTHVEGSGGHAEGYQTSVVGGAPGGHAEGYQTYSMGLGTHAEGSQTSAVGNYSHAEGQLSLANGIYSHAEGYTTRAENASHAEGWHTYASDTGAHVEGYFSSATGHSSHAEGNFTLASSLNSHAEGQATIASGNESHAEGYKTSASGDRSHSEGYATLASGGNAHSEGFSTVATGGNSYAGGILTIASGDGSRATGYQTSAIGEYSHGEGNTTRVSSPSSHSEGYQTIVEGGAPGGHGEGYQTYVNSNIGPGTHAEGYQTSSTGMSSHSEGYATQAKGNASHAEGQITYASGNGAHAGGYQTLAIGNYSVAQNYKTSAHNVYSHTEGGYTQAKGTASHAEGWYSEANGEYSHSEGQNTYALGNSSHAEGYETVASGNYSHAEGNATSATGIGSHSDGNATLASGDYSYAGGTYTIADKDFMYVIGTYNSPNSEDLFEMGVGTSAGDRKNAIEVTSAGVMSLPQQDGNITNDSHVVIKKYYDDNMPFGYGTSADRPSSPTLPYMYFDSDYGIPLWYTGANWVNSTGAIVQ